MDARAVSTSSIIASAFRDEAPFWEALDRGAFELPTCGGCGVWNWPPTPRCPHCGSFAHDWVPTELAGTVYSWTRIWTNFSPERSAEGPFVVLLVELPHAGHSRVIGTLEGSEDALAIGSPVRGRIKSRSPEARGMPSVVWSIVGRAGGEE